MLASVATTIAALGALWFTNQSIITGSRQYSLDRQVAVTDRFQKAVEQLSSDEVDIQLSGVYLLEQLASDSPDIHSPVFEVLAAFVRRHTDRSDPAKRNQCDLVGAMDNALYRAPVVVQAIIDAIGHRDASNDEDGKYLDLSWTCLGGLDLSYGNFTGVSFRGAMLSGADLTGANLINTYLGGATLMSTFLHQANLTGSNLQNADLTTAMFGTDDDFEEFKPAILDRADLSGARLSLTNFNDVDLSTVKLARTVPGEVRDTVIPAEFEDVSYNEGTRWPPGFVPPGS